MNLNLVIAAVLAGGLAGLGAAAFAAGAPNAVAESARQIPVAHCADVVVVGGGTGAVSAAVAAAKAGAKVFLIAPRTYLGEDMCGTLRLWLEEGEEPSSPLARAIFSPPPPQAPGAAPAVPVKRGAPFSYQTDIPSAPMHRDSTPPGKLTDGLYNAAATQSVQYDGDVMITADLGSVQALRRAAVLVYQRKAAFEVQDVEVSISADGKTWQPAAKIANGQLDKGNSESRPIELAAAVSGTGRYVRLLVRKTPDCKRILLGEVVIETDKSAAAAAGEKAAAVAPPAPAPAPAAVADRPAAETTPAQPITTPAQRVTTPMQVKVALDEALLAAGVKFLFSSYATDVLRDGSGKQSCGVVMANRAGRQAVIAKVIIDATDRAWVARMAGAAFSPFPAGDQSFRRVIIGGQVRTAPGLTARRTGLTVPAGRAQPAEIIEYALTIPMADGGFASFAAAEQQARDATFDPGMLDEAETLFQVPPDAMKGRKAGGGDWRGIAGLEIDSFRPACRDDAAAGPAGVERLYVLGGCADIPREQASRLLRPLALMEMGERIGRAAAEEAKAIPAPTGVTLPADGPVPAAMGEVREFLTGVRPAAASGGAPAPAPAGPAGPAATVPQAARALPVLARYDVVVIGGGTGGAPAGIGAASQGARTLVVEHLHGLGGVGTVGLIGSYYHGYRGGFTAEVDRGVAAVGEPGGAAKGGWNVLWKMHWWRSQLRKAGADVWFGAAGCGALVRDGRIIGAVVASPAGRGVVLAGTVIDATGNADVAAAAGAATMYTDGTCLAVQGTGLPPRALGASYTNTDYTFADETDMLDVWGLFVSARRKYRGAYDMGQLIDTRERRRIVGDAVIGVLDPINGRTFSDTIAQASSDFDSHGYTVHPYFFIVPPGRKEFRTYIPYRAMLPSGMDGILVIGLGLSAHRDAVPLIRMQPDVQNHGYAAGLAAAAIAKGGIPTRQLNLRPIQEMLVKSGDLPPEVLAHKDSYPIPSDRIAEAVKSLPKDPSAVAVVMTHPDVAVPMLREAYAAAGDPEAKLKYAHVLGVCGDGAGLDTILQAVSAAKEWDKGWNFKGMGQYGASSSELDSLIFALGQIADRKAVPAILEKVAMLDAGKELSHHRAVARALESIRDPAAAGPLAELLARPGMTGYAVMDVAAAGQPAMPHEGDMARSKSLRELFLAAALYRCGDKDSLGRKILTQYAADLRGHYARFAAAVLQEGTRR